MLGVFSEKIKQTDGYPFSNGRYARNCFDAVYQQHAINFRDQSDNDRNTISEYDVKPILAEILAID